MTLSSVLVFFLPYFCLVREIPKQKGFILELGGGRSHVRCEHLGAERKIYVLRDYVFYLKCFC